MAAPTPVSALVHSSTLVTAGVYLTFRFFYVFQINNIIEALLTIGTLTILIAGIAALKETDAKKIVALSTLSQLGLIISALGLCLHKIAFFHLITHAFIKAMLFISIGNLIHSSIDYQDIRKSRIIFNMFPMSRCFFFIGNLGLCGFPFLAGFYSKDL